MFMRSLAAVLAAGLVAHTLLLAPALAETPRVSPPVTHGNVSIYLLKGKSTSGPVPLTLTEALSRNAVEVHETGNVRELKIENKGDAPVFVQMGDIVKGGQQDRVLTVSLVLEPRSGLVPLGAYCVEQGRWAARGKEDARRFALSDSLIPSREAKVAIARPLGEAAPIGEARQAPAPAARSGAPIEVELEATQRREAQRSQRVAGDAARANVPGRGAPDSQMEVWHNVGRLQRLLSSNLASSVASESSRTSLQLSLESEALRAAQAAYVAALEPAASTDDDVVGVAIAVGGRLASADLYPSNGLFRKMWPKIVRAAATEGLAYEGEAAASPSVEAVAAFLSEVETGRRSERAIGALATLVTLESDRVLSVRSDAPKGAFVHRTYLAK